MRVQAVHTGVASHDFAMSFMLEVLREQGHEVVRAGFFRGEGEFPPIASTGFECTVSPLNQPFNARHDDFLDPARPWILYSHGISLHKPFSMAALGIDFSFYPQAAWVDYLAAYHQDTCRAVATNGWGKLDLLWALAQKCRQEIKEDVYAEFGLNRYRPLVVFAPTWSREEWPTWKLWQENGPHPSLYRCAGTEYMAPEILKALHTLDANVVYLPHNMGADNEKGIDLSPERRVELLAAADVLVSDTSSMVAEFLVFDKPIVQVARMPEDRLAGHLHLFHEPTLPPCIVGDPIYDLSRLAETVARRCEVDEYAEVRRFWRDYAVGDIDGFCAQREAAALESAVFEWHSTQRPHEPGHPPGGHPSSETSA